MDRQEEEKSVEMNHFQSGKVSKLEESHNRIVRKTETEKNCLKLILKLN
jgi:hypothetical protein